MEWGASSILSLRKSAGMTQARLAQWLGVTTKQVKHLEHQRRNPSGPASRLLDILAEQLGNGHGSEVQVIGSAVPAPKPRHEKPSPVAEEATIEERRPEPEATSDQQRDSAFVWE